MISAPLGLLRPPLAPSAPRYLDYKALKKVMKNGEGEVRAPGDDRRGGQWLGPQGPRAPAWNG